MSRTWVSTWTWMSLPHPTYPLICHDISPMPRCFMIQFLALHSPWSPLSFVPSTFVPSTSVTKGFSTPLSYITSSSLLSIHLLRHQNAVHKATICSLSWSQTSSLPLASRIKSQLLSWLLRLLHNTSLGFQLALDPVSVCLLQTVYCSSFLLCLSPSWEHSLPGIPSG